ncbi:MAG: hypothetical protein JW699_00170 [Chitinispirillaceae bacterium]|nr:hypothetical protein [Chitinispirillaceae bacterium]
MDSQAEHLPQSPSPSVVAGESLLSVLGVVYSHRKTADGGDMYLTRFGHQYADALELDKWYEKEWFEAKRERLEGTSAVYYVPTREVNGRSVELVVKNCRVGEDVPIETRALIEFINTEFNSPWEEFALVMELREGKYGPPDVRCNTQEPLAIYVPPGRMQVWQSGRSYEKINRIRARHPGIDIDILRQYKLIYGWIRGRDIQELCAESGMAGAELDAALLPLTKKATSDLEKKGYVMADMKPCHIIIGEDDANKVEKIVGNTDEDTRRLRTLLLSDIVAQGGFSVIDYELLVRTPPHEEEVHWSRRHSYLDDQRNRFKATGLPHYLSSGEVLGVPYVFGEVQSTGGKLWVVGRNARLFDYFLPERWRKTHAWKLSENNDVYYTVTKDHIHLVWKVSRVGDRPVPDSSCSCPEKLEEYGYNSPFETFAIAHHLNENGVPTVYSRAIYMTGTVKAELPGDARRYDSHRMLRGADGGPLLLEDHDYMTLQGYFNGTDEWVARQTDMQLCRPFNLEQAAAKGLIDAGLFRRLFDKVKSGLRNLGYDGILLKGSNLLLALDPKNELLKDGEGLPEARICNCELIHKT